MSQEAGNSFEAALRREIMRSELQRMQALAIILGLLLVVTTLGANFMTDIAHRLFNDRISGWMPIAAIGPFFVYEIGAVLLLRWRMAHDLDFPRAARFGNALVETSLPGVMIYLLAGRMEPALVLCFWPPLLYFIFILLSTLRLDFWLSLWTGFVAAVQQNALADYFLGLTLAMGEGNQAPLYHFSRSVVLLVAGVVAGVVAVSLRRQFENSALAAASRDRVTSLFGQHVSPAVVDQLLAQASDPPSEMRTVCVMFLDIRGFTAMTRQRSADETVALLNDFFAEMIDVVDRHNGIINKFLGDGFLAIFGAPLHDPAAARNALAAGHAMLDVVDRWNGARTLQALRIGIGIHCGEAVTGTVGSPQRKEYTVIGDTVNLAARLEQLTKDTGARILVSDSLREAAAAENAIDLGELPVRGYSEGVRVWRVA
ncbi:MAG: adenylate/guanylate cyclase domain-containing protein [Acidimicrobiia bacterium]